MKKQATARAAASVLAACLLTVPAMAMEVPVSDTVQTIDGKDIIVKVFEVNASVDPETLIESTLSRNGVAYTMETITKQDISDTAAKPVTQEQTVEFAPGKGSDWDATSAAIKELPAYVDYDDGVYAGKLYGVTSTLVVEETGRTSHSGQNTTTKQYTLEYNDDSLVPNSVTENGKTYSLKTVTWSEGQAAEEGGIPDNYVATATYTRPYSYSTVDGYKATMSYSGEVTKKEAEKIRYTLTYTPSGVVKDDGTVVPDKTVGAHTEDGPEEPDNGMAAVLSLLGGGAVGAGATYIFTKRKENGL